MDHYLKLKGDIFVHVFTGHISLGAEAIALKKAELSGVAGVLRDVWTPKHGVPATLLPENGPQLAASVVHCFCESLEARK